MKLETIMFCHKSKTSKYNRSLDKFWYNDIQGTAWSTNLFDEEKPIFKIKVRPIKEGEESIYWGWWSNKENKFIYVYPSRGILSMVFPYAMEGYVERGEGKDYNVMIEVIEEVKP